MACPSGEDASSGKALRRVPIKIHELGQTICFPNLSRRVCNDSLSHHFCAFPSHLFLNLYLSCIEDNHGPPQAVASNVEGPWPFQPKVHNYASRVQKLCQYCPVLLHIMSVFEVVVHGAGAGVESLCNPLPAQPWNYHFTRAAREITSNPHLHLVGLLICRVSQLTRQPQALSSRQTFSSRYIHR